MILHRFLIKILLDKIFCNEYSNISVLSIIVVNLKVLVSIQTPYYNEAAVIAIINRQYEFVSSNLRFKKPQIVIRRNFHKMMIFNKVPGNG